MTAGEPTYELADYLKENHEIEEAYEKLAGSLGYKNAAEFFNGGPLPEGGNDG